MAHVFRSRTILKYSKMSCPFHELCEQIYRGMLDEQALRTRVCYNIMWMSKENMPNNNKTRNKSFSWLLLLLLARCVVHEPKRNSGVCVPCLWGCVCLHFNNILYWEWCSFNALCVQTKEWTILILSHIFAYCLWLLLTCIERMQCMLLNANRGRKKRNSSKRKIYVMQSIVVLFYVFFCFCRSGFSDEHFVFILLSHMFRSGKRESNGVREREREEVVKKKQNK